MSSDDVPRPPVELLEALFEAAPYGVAFYDADLRFLAVNPAFAAMGGLPRENHAGRSLSDVLPHLADQILPHLASVLTRGTPIVGIELTGIRNRTRATQGRWLAEYHPIHSKSNVAGVLAIVSDITVRRRAEALLLVQKELLERCAQGETIPAMLDRITRTILEHSTDGAQPSILLLDSMKLRHGSAPTLPAAYVEAIEGTTIGPTAGSCGTAAYLNEPVYVQDIATDRRWDDYRNYALPHGLRACWSVPIRGTDGRVLGTFALYYTEPKLPSADDLALIDLLSRTTAVLLEWRRGEQGRQELLKAEQDANRSKDEFLATLSHELRTPLNAILGWARVLRVGATDSAMSARALSAIERNAEAQVRLVNDLLDMSRVRIGRLDLQVETVDLNTVIEAALDAVRPGADSKGVVLNVQVTPQHVALRADGTRLRQVIWNLLSNAVKFTDSGGHVELRVEQDADRLCISIEDDGVGIPQDLLPHIFSRYRQGAGSHGGLGLGLAIAREVVELHGGSLHADSAGSGRGARFVISLPAASRVLQGV